MLLYMTFLCASAVFFFGSRLPSSSYNDDDYDSARQWRGWPRVSDMFVFGGSYTDIGFDVDGEQPSRANPFGNPEEAGFNANGPQWIRKMTVKYNSSFIHTYDLAAGPESPMKSLEDQVNQLFLPKYSLQSGEATWNPEETLFVIAFGVNDIRIDDIAKLENMDIEVDLAMEYRRSVRTLYDDGARNFLFLNTPPINRSPEVLFLNPDKMLIHDIAYRVLDTNQRIHSFAQEFTDEHDDVTIFYFDLNALYQEVLDDPGAYVATQNIKNTTNFCPLYAMGTSEFDAFIPECGIPVNQYFWLDEKQPTWPIHETTAYQIVKMLQANKYINW